MRRKFFFADGEITSPTAKLGDLTVAKFWLAPVGLIPGVSPGVVAQHGGVPAHSTNMHLIHKCKKLLQTTEAQDIAKNVQERRRKFGALMMNYPCLFCPSDNLEHCLALPTRSRASVRALFYWYMFCDPRRCENNRKVRAPRRVSVSGSPHCHLDETNMDITTVHHKKVE